MEKIITKNKTVYKGIYAQTSKGIDYKIKQYICFHVYYIKSNL